VEGRAPEPGLPVVGGQLGGDGRVPGGESRYTFVVTEADADTRLDVALGRRAELGSRSRVAGLIASKAVTVDGALRPKSYLLAEGQTVEVILPDREPLVAGPGKPPTVPILYEDEWLLVVDKPAGMAVHPSRGHSSGTLVHALMGHGLAGGERFRPGVVHRLDKDTSGLLVVARSGEVHRQLVSMMQQRAIDRRYLALVHGGFAPDSGTIEAPIGRDPVRRTSMTVGGVAPREAGTHFRVLDRLGDFTLLEVRLETGRTHQIRVHLLAIGHPVAGDPTYARRDALNLGRQFLHSYRISFTHPVTREEIRVEAPLPDDLAAVVARLRRSAQAGAPD